MLKNIYVPLQELGISKFQQVQLGYFRCDQDAAIGNQGNGPHLNEREVVIEVVKIVLTPLRLEGLPCEKHARN